MRCRLARSSARSAPANTRRNDNAANTGAEVASAVLYGPLAASTADRPAVAIVRLAEIAEALLTGFDAGARNDLAEQFVIVRQ